MIKRLLAWLTDFPMEEQEKAMVAERQLEEKKEQIDESIERGRESADKLKQISCRQVAEAHVTIATLRGLLTLLQDKEDNQ